MKVLIFCAHPDDLEFSIPNLIISLAGNPDTITAGLDEDEKVAVRNALEKSAAYLFKDGKRTGGAVKLRVAVMTRGEMSSFTEIIRSTKKAAAVRTKELIRSQKILTGRLPDFLGFFDGFVKPDRRTVEFIENYIGSLKPDIVMAPEPLYTWYHHRDHVNTGKAVYLALRRIKKKGNRTPLLFYFHAIWNDWYFPVFGEFEPLVKAALDSHRSQQGILLAGKLPKILESFFHGLHIRGFRKGEALRYQPIVTERGKYHSRSKRFAKLPFPKKFVYYFSRAVFKLELEDYETRMNFNDGTLPPSVRTEWDPE